MIKGIFTLGPFAVPRYLLLFLISASLAHLILFFLLKGSRKKFTFAADLFSGMVITFFLFWRLSLILTHWQTVSQSPTALLYLPGGPLNDLLGSLAAALYLLLKIRMHKGSARDLRAVVLLIAMTFLWGAVIHMTVTILTPEKEPVPGVSRNSEILLEDFNGRKTGLIVTGRERTIVNFWATWCPPCRAELPEFSRYYQDYDPGKVRLIAVNLTSTEQSVQSVLDFTGEYSLDFPVLLDPNGDAARTFSISSVPTTLVFDKDGSLVDSKTGAVDYNWLKKAGNSR